MNRDEIFHQQQYVDEGPESPVAVQLGKLIMEP